ncbi:MAG: hypothetical protein ETSY1_29375 [Candidatus Entotheonella factor]|uniref:DUF3179 domain-containing protein n=1 Tax=Entotheonella factor TaxID=1429438 RepID=W4LEH8_ENTF1|nr:MAG: hypothetical protein ETSY1_29375 [Candidatus Entotheonella factor]
MNLTAMIGLGVWGVLMCSMAAMPPSVQAEQGKAFKIHNILPKDAIQAVLEPEFVSVEKAQVADSAAMIGAVFNGEAHVYSAVLLNSHEVVNDTVGGVNIATTW